MGPISLYLGLKIKKNHIKKILKLSQPAYIDKILAKYYLNQVKPYNVPINKKILPPNKGPKASQVEQKPYQRMIRSLIFSMIEIKPNIAFATSVIS